MRVLLFVALAAAVEAEAKPHSGGRGRHTPHALKQEGRRDGRDVTRVKDEGKLKHDQQLVAESSAELNKLHADRDRLKQKEVGVLSRREEATKSAMADAALVIQRLEGQVGSQERELSRQKAVISGLEGDLSTMGQALLARAPAKEAPVEKPSEDQARLVEGLEKDVERNGAALLAHRHEAEAVRDKSAAREKLLGRAARGLADRARALEGELSRPESAKAARPLAESIVADARKLERALLRGERPEEPAEQRAPAPPAEHGDDVARALEFERRPGPRLAPAELEQPERVALERAVERAQIQRSDEQEAEQLNRGHLRRPPARLVHRDAAPADAEADIEDETTDEVIGAPLNRTQPEAEAELSAAEPAAVEPAVEPAAAEPAVELAVEPAVEPASLTHTDRDDAVLDDADTDSDSAAVEEEATADDSDDEDDAPESPDAPPSPADTAPADSFAQRLSD